MALRAAYLQRKTGEETVAQAREAAGAAKESAKVADRAAQEINEWRKREETMRLLRSGAEMASKAKSDSTVALVGLAMLETLREADNIVQAVDKDFIDRVIDAITDAAMADVGDDDDPVVTPGAYR